MTEKQPNILTGPRQALLWLIRVLIPSAGVESPLSAWRASHRWATLGDWVRRYGFAECAGVAGALLGSLIVRHFTGRAVLAAYGAAWGETIGYSCVILAREYASERDHRSRLPRDAAVSGFDAVGRIGTGLLAEFGPAGALDTFVTRPLAMGYGTRFLGPVVGIVVGKLVADVLFYVPVVVVYEQRKRARERRQHGGGGDLA